MHTRLLGKCNLLQLDVNGHLGAKSSPFRPSSTAEDKTFDRRLLVRSPFRAIFTEKLRARRRRRKHGPKQRLRQRRDIFDLALIVRLLNKKMKAIIRKRNKIFL